MQRGFSARTNFLTIEAAPSPTRTESGDASVFSKVLPIAFLIVFLIPMGLVFLFGIFFVTICDIVWTSTSFPADATHVPTFYVPRHRYHEYCHIWLLFVFGTIFGCIHCAGWYLHFATVEDQRNWIAASVAILPIVTFLLASIVFLLIILIALLSSPLVGSIAILFSIFRPIFVVIFLIVIFSLIFSIRCSPAPIYPTDPVESNLDPIDTTLPTTGIRLTPNQQGNTGMHSLLAYATTLNAVARLYLLGLAVVLLRQQPPSAFIAVEWTKLYPHIF